MTPITCRACRHDKWSHDPTIGCLFPHCICIEFELSIMARIGVFLAKAGGLGIFGAALFVVGIMAVWFLLTGCYPKEVDPRYNQPSPSIDPSGLPLQMSRQEP